MTTAVRWDARGRPHWHHAYVEPCACGRCDMAADDPRHGTTNGYGNRDCRCPACRQANTDDHREYMRRRSALRRQEQERQYRARLRRRQIAGNHEAQDALAELVAMGTPRRKVYLRLLVQVSAECPCGQCPSAPLPGS